MRQFWKRLLAVGAVASLVVVGGPVVANPTAVASANTTAWQNGRFVVDTPNLVRRSNLVLDRANTAASEFVPLGNGTLGAAAWAANGFTAQLNRGDTFPDRKSPGWVTIPGLSRLTGASDFKSRLDLYDGTLHQSGGGMTLRAYVRADASQLVVDVSGADPGSTQTAQVKLWSSRSPSAQASGSVATLSETWTDSGTTGASGQRFGTLAGIGAGGRNVSASTPDSRTGQVTFRPNADGSFRVVVVSPGWTGGDAISTTKNLLGGDLTRPSADLAAGHLAWWHNYWNTVGLIKITSADGSGEYFENMRTLYLYDIAASNRGSLPGSQAGEANLFNPSQDSQPWYPAGYWFWNLRMYMQANLSAGAFSLNSPIFNLYRSNLDNIAAWTRDHFPGRQGLCVPETMRFNGNGYYAPGWAEGNASCDSLITPSYNSQTVTTGAEISLWIWQTYLMTDDKSFLTQNYPLMKGAAQFLLSHAKTGSDGLLHTTSNGHETQWAVNDPTTDVAAMQSLFPVVVSAAQTLGVDSDLVGALRSAIPKIRPLPRTDTATQTQVLDPSSDASGTTMLALSAQPTATKNNTENLGLEAVWPYSLIGDSGNQSELGRRTFTHRSYVTENDWSFDALHAARLGLGDQMRTAMTANVAKYQVFPNGMASWNAQPETPYLEQLGVNAAAIGEGLVQHYDGTLRIAPGWPSSWDVDGSVYIQHKGKAHVQIRGGTLVTVAVEAGANGNITVRNPWPGQNVMVLDGSGGTVLSGQNGATLTIPARAGTSYLIQRPSAPTTSLPFAAVSGSPATAPKSLNGRVIGLAR
ncbi:glycosyl hydrolase family 95 catalytic domain-containing protein [Streptomyces sp. NPDC051677]|uniref:glycosyl hydrolase family 95 catalytic domain-containing protein n=1 Tax=Streptomyces sp. NPDC051677 TaxID=3365669 RepID=UPI0037D83929